MKFKRYCSSLTERPFNVPKAKIRAISCSRATGIAMTINLAATTDGEYCDHGCARDDDAAG